MEIKQGDYLSRNGQRITVLEIKQGSTFSVKGYIWKENGQYSAVGDNPLDIVSEFN